MSIILAVVVVLGASGDPYILRDGAPSVFSPAQDSALQTLMAERFSGLTYSAIYSVECYADDDDRPWNCTVKSWVTPSWADIRASLLNQVTWEPGRGGAYNTWLVGVSKSWVSNAAWRAHAQTIWGDLLASPMLRLSYVRQNGTGSFVGSLLYKRSMNQSGIATAVQAGETLIPSGVTP
jgi:hypothetical protein